MAEIKLTNSDKLAIVDDSSAYRIRKFGEWRLDTQENTEYATHGHFSIKMHHVVLSMQDLVFNNFEIHHKNGNGLDNRKENLEVLTRQQHLLTRDKQKNNTTGFKGVAYKASKKGEIKKYVAQVTINGKRTHLGYFETAVEAAQAYNEAAVKHYGPNALLNKI